MKNNRPIDNIEAFLRSLADRIFLGTLILIGIALGIGVVYSCAYCIVYLLIGEWPKFM